MAACVAKEPAFKARSEPHHLSHTSQVSLMKMSTSQCLCPSASLRTSALVFVLRHLSHDAVFCADRRTRGLKLFRFCFIYLVWEIRGGGVALT